jgi:hypothetical protein
MTARKHLLGMRCIVGAALTVFLLFVVNSAGAQTPSTIKSSVTGTSDWDQWKRNCSLLKEFRKKFISCATSTFTSHPFHFLAQSIVPGSGVGGGGRYMLDLNEKNGAQDQLQATSVITIRQFWLTELKFSSQRTIDRDWNKSGESLGLNIYARNRSLPIMTFYGLGPNSSVSNPVKFSQRDTSAGIEVTTPFPEVSWLSTGGKIEGLWPNIGGVTGDNLVPIEHQYTEQTAPGLAAQPPMVHEQVFLRSHKRFIKRFELNTNVIYNFYQDTSTGHYSFQRFETTVEQRFYPQKKKHGGVIEQNYFSLLWRYSVSNAGAGHAIPFYLQETIGGSDIDNQPSLRAFKDYRFRGPDLMTVQAEYDRKLCEICMPCKPALVHTVCSHLGLLASYEAGAVALRKSDLRFSSMHQSFGGGVSLYLGKDVIFRMALALGGGEGAHPYFGIANFLQ